MASKQFTFFNPLNLFFLILALSYSILILGFDSFLITNTKWIHHSESDISQTHIGWYFFKNDIWRFPLGSNPNYGDGFGSSIIFSDSIASIFFPLFLLKYILGTAKSDEPSGV